jgi:acyl carrier protein
MTVPSEQEVLATIQAIAKAELDREQPILMQHRLIADLGIDSLGSMILAVGLENHYRVRLNEQDAATLVTVADVIALVRKRVADAQ